MSRGSTAHAAKPTAAVKKASVSAPPASASAQKTNGAAISAAYLVIITIETACGRESDETTWGKMTSRAEPSRYLVHSSIPMVR